MTWKTRFRSGDNMTSATGSLWPPGAAVSQQTLTSRSSSSSVIGWQKTSTARQLSKRKEKKGEARNQ